MPMPFYNTSQRRRQTTRNHKTCLDALGALDLRAVALAVLGEREDVDRAAGDPDGHAEALEGDGDEAREARGRAGGARL